MGPSNLLVYGLGDPKNVSLQMGATLPSGSQHVFQDAAEGNAHSTACKPTSAPLSAQGRRQAGGSLSSRTTMGTDEGSWGLACHSEWSQLGSACHVASAGPLPIPSGECLSSL